MRKTNRETIIDGGTVCFFMELLSFVDGWFEAFYLMSFIAVYGLKLKDVF